MSSADVIGLAFLRNTIGNEQWMRGRIHDLRELFPEQWTKADQSHVLRVGMQLKIMGVQWTTEDQLTKILVYFNRVKVCESKQLLGVLWIRRAPIAGAPPPPAPPPEPPSQQQQRVDEFLAKLAKNRK